MASREGLGWLGRVPIDTVLVGLLDAVSKGEVPTTGTLAEVTTEEVPGGSSTSFPLLDRYLQTTSSKVWKDITDGVVNGIESRKKVLLEGLQNGNPK